LQADKKESLTIVWKYPGFQKADLI